MSLDGLKETANNSGKQTAGTAPAAPVPQGQASKPSPGSPAPASTAVSSSTPVAAKVTTTSAPAAPPAEAGVLTPIFANPLKHLPIPFEAVDYMLKGYHVDATVASDQVVWAAQQLDREGFSLDTITGVDWIAQSQMEVVYDYFHPLRTVRAVIRCRIPRDNPELPTISKVFPGANWHERETHDFFGIRFLGHPNLLPFLLPEDATYHPLRKDFTA